MTAQEFKNARLELDMTQKELAAALGYKFYNHVAKLESGGIPIQKQTELAIKYLLRVTQ
jgi:transcriptional regulator with XRE-family HTH domain